LSQDEKHLNIEQLEWLLDAKLVRAANVAPSLESEHALRHLATCTPCQKLVLMHESFDRKLRALASGVVADASKDCPPQGTWFEVVVGLRGSEAEGLLGHAAECDHCGPALRMATEIMAENKTAEEDALLMALPSAQTSWQEALSRRMALQSKEPQDQSQRREKPASSVRMFFLRVWPYAAVATTVALLVIAGEFWRSGLQHTNRLLEEAYTQERVIEPRVGDAARKKLNIERGSGKSSLERPAALLRAEAIISENLNRHPYDPGWLSLKGRAALIENDYKGAISAFERVLETKPELGPVMTDLATAYFERADVENRAIDYSKALELQTAVLRAHPNDAVALFNRAITYERVHAYGQAVADWESYLRLDSKGGWASEARERLSAVKEKLNPRSKNEDSIDGDAAAFTEQLDGRGGIPRSEVHGLAEAYLDTATTVWLPRVVAERLSNKTPSEPVLEALNRLASILKDAHNDEWLQQMLETRPSESFLRALGKLGKAIESNVRGQYEPAVREANQSERLFEASGSKPGVLRARFEKVYALSRADQGYHCLAAGGPLLTALNAGRFTWLRAQALTELATCRFVVGDMESASALSVQAVEVARKGDYRALYLRVLGNAASFRTVLGDLNASWQQNEDGLAEYWSGTFPPARAFQFYSELSYAAEAGEEPQTAVAMAKEAVRMIVQVGNPVAEALARSRLATLAIAAGDDELARKEMLEADRLFSMLPPSSTATTFRAAGNVMRAAMEAQRGETDRALQLLSEVRGALPTVSNLTVPLQFYQTLGDVYLKQGDYERSARALRSAISIGEAGARSIASTHEGLVWNREVGNVYRELVKIWSIEEVHRKDALELWEAYRSLPIRAHQSARLHADNATGVDFRRLELGPEPSRDLKIDNVLPQLKTQTVLSYVEMPDGVAVWLFDDRGVIWQWTAVSRELLDKTIERFVRACADRNSSQISIDEDGKQLYRWLVNPLSKYLDTARDLIVEPDGMIATLPFEALLDEFGKPMGERFAVTSSPGLGYFTHLKDRVSITRDAPALIVGPPTLTAVAGGEVRIFPGVRDEVQLLAKSMLNARQLLDDEATVDAVRQLLPQAVILHFGGHAVFEPSHAGLVLVATASAGGPMKSELLEAPQLEKQVVGRCQLVVLAACSTGRVPLDKHSDPETLVRALLGAGVPHVVASRWDVDSGTTTKFVALFYESLFAGHSVGRALRDARTELRSEAETAHPFFWAAFGGFGRS
jgi:CHAT domain-containing protein/cytochrome c-type biogenesis protein CcmH/NrfG